MVYTTGGTMTTPNLSTTGDAADLAKFGYKQSMERRTGRFASFAVAFAFVSIATGIFTTYGAVLNSSGPLGIWTWPIATIGQLAVAFVLGALAARIPVTGYHYQWMSRLANPILGWILGWISFTFLAIVVVAVDYTIVDDLSSAAELRRHRDDRVAGDGARARGSGTACRLFDAMGGAGEQRLRLTRADRHGDADGAAADRGRRAR
jgi:hypothetical protein